MLLNHIRLKISIPVATLDLGVQGSGDGNLSLYRNWGLSSPDNRVQKDYFAMQASTRTNMQAGKLYQVRTKSDDGTRFLLKNLALLSQGMINRERNESK
jgi:hypothetical protein